MSKLRQLTMKLTNSSVNMGFRISTRERISGTGRRPAVVLGFDEVTTHVLRHLQPRVHSMFWKERTLTVHVMAEHSASEFGTHFGR
jgi:hypothetical protein